MYDGILTSLKMMEVMLAKKLPMSKLAEPLKIYPQSKDFRKLRSSDVLAILLIAYGHILPKLFEFFKLNIEIAQNIFCHFSIVVENMGVSNENLSKIDIRILFL